EPHIGDMPVKAVDTAAVVRVLTPIWTAIPETAMRLRGRIEDVLDAARVQGCRDGDNPARWRGHLDHLLPKRKKKREGVQHLPALPYAEAPAFMTALRADIAAKHNDPDAWRTARALEFAILTCTRESEICGTPAVKDKDGNAVPGSPPGDW